MADQTPETKEEREARWWREWWAADYSWAGLANKEILRGGQWGEKTLQDYWRRDPDTGKRRTDAALKEAGELVEFDGRWWHLAHLPPKARADVQTSWKAGAESDPWARLSTLITGRLVQAKDTPGKFGSVNTPRGIAYIPSGPDRRARFDGVVVQTLPQLRTPPPGGEAELIQLACDEAAFLAGLDCEDVGFGPGSSFYGVLFSRCARFARATFSGETGFHTATFSEDAGFKHAVFSGYAGFDRATFSGNADFDGTTLTGDARFAGATFSGSVSFHGATFSGKADFVGTSYSRTANFDDAKFSGIARLHSGVFSGNASFAKATFSGEADFVGATFLAIAYFGSATFLENAAFNGATFSGNTGFRNATFTGGGSFGIATFGARATFGGSTFSENAEFSGATFSENADFSGAIFSGTAFLEGAVFSGTASFDGASFLGVADFNSTIFSGDAGFIRSRFAKAATFSGRFERGGSFRDTVFERHVTFSARVDQPELGFAGAFYGARFGDIANFSKSGPLRPGTADRNDGARMAIAFAETLFDKTLILTDGFDADVDANRAFRAGLATIIAEAPDRREDLLDTLEAGCRTVKIAMGKARDEAPEQRYYRFQLQARHARQDTHWTEKVFGRLYGAVSDYGGSLGRPLAYLIGLTVAFGFIYWLWAGIMSGALAADVSAISGAFLSGESWANPAAAMTFSTGRSLFISAWLGVPEKDPTSWQWIFLNGYGPGWGLLVRIVAALQSIASGILIFLFALAVRRRFQIGG